MADCEPKRVLIRVKRRRSASPVQALVLNAKRQRQDDAGPSGDPKPDVKDDNVKKVFQFAATALPGHESKLLDKLSEPGPRPATPTFGHRPRRTPRRKGVKEVTKSGKGEKSGKNTEKRFTVIQSKRGIQIDAESDKYDVVTIKDAEEDLAYAPVTAEVPEADDQHYTYDYYYSYEKELKFEEIGDAGEILGCDIENLREFLNFQPEFYDSESGPENVDEDSNAEDNWRNDYPDELSDDDELYSGFNDYRHGYADEEVSGASTSDEDELVYSVREDSNRHGAAYARFKHQVLKDFRKMNINDDDGEEKWDDDELDPDDDWRLDRAKK